MKTLNQFISEALIKNASKKTKTTVKPKDIIELKQIIKDTIEKEGNNCDLNFIDTSGITDMHMLFYYQNQFNGDISEWDVSNVADMSWMFKKSDFSGDISKWDVSNVENMEMMFNKSDFSGDISKWDVSNVKNMAFMFYDSKFDGDISNWVVPNVQTTRGMFRHSPLEHTYDDYGEAEIKNGRFVKQNK